MSQVFGHWALILGGLNPCQDGLGHLGEASKKKQVFFGVFPKGGGGLAESKISLAEKTEIFLDFFWQNGWKGGRVSPIPKGF